MGFYSCVRRKNLSIHLQDGTGSTFTAGIADVAEPMTSVEAQDTADGVKVRAKVTGISSREHKAYLE
jgi:hypothetical protein